MQSPRVDPLTPFEKATLRETLQDILTDTDIKTSITYKPFSSETVNLKTGVISRTAASTAVDAIRRQMTNKEVDQSGGTLQITDQWYLVDQDDLSAAPQKSDRLVEGSTEYEVVDWRGAALGLIWEIAARKV